VDEGRQWGPWPHDNIAPGVETVLPEEPARLHDNIAAGIEQDGAKLVVMCDEIKAVRCAAAAKSICSATLDSC
jgi:hypothetical protein